MVNELICFFQMLANTTLEHRLTVVKEIQLVKLF